MAARVAVAASGGRDSTALLHCTVRAAAASGVEVVALHVHHGLVAEADDWLRHVRAQARRWGAGFDSRRLDGAPAAGQSVEAWARRGRYRALAEMARAAGCSLVLLAHHRRDQAETVLLQALRGAGPAGLAAMPREVPRDGLSWARPWLDRPREAIEAYVRKHRLRHVDDASNDDSRYARNRLRLHAWPAFAAAFPDAEQALCAVAAQAQHAARLAREVAASDLGSLLDGQALLVPAWLALTPARRRNALAAWLQSAVPGPVPETLLARLLDELPGRTAGAWPAPGGGVQLYRGRLHVAPAGAAKSGCAAGTALDLSQPGIAHLEGWPGHFEIRPVTQAGAPAAQLRSLVVHERVGGERFRLAPRAAARSLKQQFQALAVPAWQRDGPLLYTASGDLVFVPGLGIEAAFQAAPGEPQLGLHWQRTGADPTGHRQRTG